MGHRLDTVSRLYYNTPPYCRGFLPFEDTFNRGITALKTITLYTFPGYFLMGVACLWKLKDPTFQPGWLLILGLIILAIGILLLPGCMTVYAVERNPEILKRPILAFQRVWKHRAQYFKAWLIALTAILISFLGFIPIGIGWLFTSVWAWEVVGYVFTISLYHPEELPG